MTVQRNPPFAALLNALKRSTMADLRVAIPARVERYDATKQLVDVQPLVQDSFTDEEGERISEPLPIVTNVPVAFQGGGGMRILFPLAKGDTVLLVFADRSLDGWQTSGNLDAPSDDRRHDLTDAVAIPGLHANTSPWSDGGESVITLGRDSDPSDFVALAQKVSDQLTVLKNAISAAAVAPNDGGASFKAALIAALSSWPASVASTSVKIKG